MIETKPVKLEPAVQWYFTLQWVFPGLGKQVL